MNEPPGAAGVPASAAGVAADAGAATGSAAAGWPALYAQLASAGGALTAFDPARSTVHIFVYRGGRMARLGHNHVLTAPQFTGYAYVPPEGPAGARFDLELRLDQLQLDDAQLRASLGPAFAAELTPGDIVNTRAHMLGEDNLQAERYPYARVHGAGASGEGGHLAAEVEIELHGRKRVQPVALRVEGSGATLSVSGALVLRQSDFGITPYAALGGLIGVQDALVVEFRLVAG